MLINVKSLSRNTNKIQKLPNDQTFERERERETEGGCGRTERNVHKVNTILKRYFSIQTNRVTRNVYLVEKIALQVYLRVCVCTFAQKNMHKIVSIMV